MKKDVIIIGAGLSGIGAACHLSIKNPNTSYIVLEARKNLGGTWDLFNYPGIRSDSDMYTFGYSFKPWNDDKSFAAKDDILKYLHEAAEENRVKERIHFNKKVVKANFKKSDGWWTLEVLDTKTQETNIYKCKVLFSCTGYYRYDEGHTPKFEGKEDFKGTIIHPQHWPENLNYKGKNVVVIGSGATAITIVPSMADQTKKITMLQRSPTYISALPNEDKIAEFIKSKLPDKIAYDAIRLKNSAYSVLFYNLCQLFPNALKKFIVNNAKKELGEFPVEPHFVPNYNPWDQRFCLAPDGDFFKAIREGKATVVTDHIERFTENGILLKSGKKLEADIIITATGLELLPIGGIELNVNDKPVQLNEKYAYKGLMLSEVPNFIFFVGYTNASWTLKSDLTSEYASRLLNYMRKRKFSYFVAELNDDIGEVPILDLKSGYVMRAAHLFPKQGEKTPWRLYQNYFMDYVALRMGNILDKNIRFG